MPINDKKDNEFSLNVPSKVVAERSLAEQLQLSFNGTPLFFSSKAVRSGDIPLAFTSEHLSNPNLSLAVTTVSYDEISRKQRLLGALYPASIPLLSKIERESYRITLKELIKLEILAYNDQLLRARAGTRAHFDRLTYNLALYVALERGENPCLTRTGEHMDGWTPLGYLGLELGNVNTGFFSRLHRYFSSKEKTAAETLDSMELNPTRKVHDTMCEFNYHRLYWLWAGGNGGFLDSIIALPNIDKIFPDIDFDRFNQRLNTPSRALGYASWIMYYARLGLNISVSIKHIFFPNELEAQLSMSERAKLQWQQRKYVILNDIVWGLVNMASFLWLLSSISPTLGVWGAALNTGLMAFDMAMAIMEKGETEKAYKEAKQGLIDEKKALNKELTLLQSGKSPLSGAEKEQRIQVILHQEALNAKELAILEQDWKYDKKRLNRTIANAGIFIVAMLMMYAPAIALVLPALTVSAPWIMMAGCILAIGLTIWQTVGDQNDEVNKVKERLHSINEQLDKIGQTLILQPKGAERNRLEFEKSALEKERDYCQQSIQHQRAKQIFSGMMLVLVPIALFMILNIASAGLMTAALVGVSLVTLACYQAINRMAPKALNPVDVPSPSSGDDPDELGDINAKTVTAKQSESKLMKKGHFFCYRSRQVGSKRHHQADPSLSQGIQSSSPSLLGNS